MQQLNKNAPKTKHEVTIGAQDTFMDIKQRDYMLRLGLPTRDAYGREYDRLAARAIIEQRVNQNRRRYGKSCPGYNQVVYPCPYSTHHCWWEYDIN